MKKIKFVISFIMMLIGFIITGESYQLYLDNFETANYSTTLFLNGSPNNTKQSLVNDITRAAEDNQVKVFTVLSDVKSMLLSERRIYGTKNTAEYIKKNFQISEKSFPSLISGTKNILFYEFEDIVHNEDIGSISQYYIIGDVDDIFGFKDSLNGKYAGNFPQKGYDSSGKLNIFFIWLLISIVMLFLSYYDVVLQKKENFIRISLGERTSSIILRNISLDIVVYSSIFLVILFALQNYTNTFFHSRISAGIFLAMLFFNAMLYSNLYFYNIKEALANIKSSKKLLVMNYGLKIITVTIALTIISSNIAVISEAIQFYQQRSFFNERADYYYVEMAYGRRPDQDEQQSMETLHKGFLETETFYRKFFKNFNAMQLVTSGVLEKDVMLANLNSLTYLQEHIDELSKANLEKELYFILSSHTKNDKETIRKLKRSLELVEQSEFQYDYDIIYYDGDPKLICIDEFSLNGSFYIQSPIIIYNNVDQSQRVESADASAFRLDYAHDILYKLSPDDVVRYAANHSTENSKLYYKLTNALEKYNYKWSIMKRTLYLNLILSESIS
ncbi:hypothetical protein GCM10008018_72670 [Paenibacillus marchantiophytorum]|uniref:DUF4173 domain-containing protein n=1 Tax=Paenibacillus marchantiophytorum TaxID=1619310 RepID=A0ABQ1FKM8_9BACL|nr:hypothetical protein [Paenibacillus marchantiophytorum]GGA18149.1 hypothetical protein GCM10008018_72670 [Paenibacillus marchantiophytorum]